MAKETKNQHQTDNSYQLRHRFSDDRVQIYLQLFSRESEQIREAIIKDLPAYNSLLSLHAFSFEELALQHIASEKGIKYNPHDPPRPNCPFCESEKVGLKKATNNTKEDLYRCYDCSRTFSANYNSICSGTKCSALTWMKLLHCLLNFSTISKTCEYCEISETTYYNLRNRIFHAMQLFLDGIKLYGNIEVDNTFVRSSYKGVNLQECEFPEESIFFDPTFKPRKAKTRGTRNLIAERNANSICIFTAIDDRGHVMTRFAGVGIASYLTLKTFVPVQKYLNTVPQQDPFPFFKSKTDNPKTKPGSASHMISDKEAAIKKYAEEYLGLSFESHVYRQNNVQRLLSPTSNNIQRVNALHRRLKTFLRNCNYISSKYLPGYLILFEFIENTGGSREAIEQIFRILARPNLGKPASFYQEMFSVPNYLESWLTSDHPLKKIPYNKLLAFYLFDHIRNGDLYPDVNISMQFVEEESGYTAPTIRKIYRELNNAGYRDLILAHFGEPNPSVQSTTQPKPTSQRSKASVTFNPVVLAIYDEYAQILKSPPHERTPFSHFLAEKNKQYGTAYKRPNMLAKFKRIEESGVRAPLPQPDPDPNRNNPISKKMLLVYEDFNKITLSYRQRGEKIPPLNIIHDQLGEKYNLSSSTVARYIFTAKSFKNKKGPET